MLIRSDPLFHKFMVSVGLSDPTIYDIMDKFIKERLTLEEISYIERHRTICRVDNHLLRIDFDGNVHFLKICGPEKYTYTVVPKCKEFSENLKYYSDILYIMKTKIEDHKKYTENRERESREEELQEVKCANKLWKSMK